MAELACTAASQRLVRSQTVALRAELEAKAAKADVWLRLNSLIGDAQGATFRRFMA